MTTLVHGLFDTRFGPAVACLDGAGALVRLGFHSDVELRRAETEGRSRRDDAAVRFIAEQIDAYGQGRRTRFELPLAAPGSPFQRAVWEALVTIPFGQTVSYGALATRLGRPGAARAVGRANATNPIALVVPCHRVIGASGALTGYAGGIELKRALLDFERGGGHDTLPFPPPSASPAQGLSRR
ncbi:MAG: methylated-DNA--[protein]-cysteine S-methyltransferase [Cystobacter sp.]